MKRLFDLVVRLAGAGALALGLSVSAASLPAGWQHEQSFAVTNAGLVKISLPVATLEAARPAQEDLRIYDDAGNEVPYVINHPLPVTQTTGGGEVIGDFAQRHDDGHHARDRLGPAGGWRDAGNAGDEFYQGGAGGEFHGWPHLGTTRGGAAGFPPALWGEPFDDCAATRGGRLAADYGG